ncbi:hypothetical protein [Streptosporangium canum]|uniref:hypothetical protein n=1 Tax=Streptosporangium canum TaxID=324952 RepID=UPI0037BB9FF3
MFASSYQALQHLAFAIGQSPGSDGLSHALLQLSVPIKPVLTVGQVIKQRKSYGLLAIP